MMDFTTSPLIALGSAALVGFIWFNLNYWKQIKEIPAPVGAYAPIPWWLGVVSIAVGFLVAYATEWRLTGIASAVLGLGITVPAVLVEIRNWQLRRDEDVDIDETLEGEAHDRR